MAFRILGGRLWKYGLIIDVLENALKRNRLKKAVEEIISTTDSRGNAVYCSNEYEIMGTDKPVNKDYGYSYTVEGNELYAYDLNNEMYF